MVMSSSRKFLLSASLATACFLTVITAMPTTSNTRQLLDSDEENFISTTVSPRLNKIRSPSLVDNNSKDNNDSDETDNANLNETSGERKPIFEVLDIIFRPSRPPSILLVDFFAKSNDSQSSETSNESTNSSESNGATSSSTESDGRDKIAVVFGTSTSRMQGSEDTTDDSSHNTTTHFAFPGSVQNPEGDDADDTAEDISTVAPTTVASPAIPTKKDGSQDNRRQKRDTPQKGNNSNREDDDDDDAGESDNSLPKNGKARPDVTEAPAKKNTFGGATDDRTSNTHISNDDGNSDEDDNGQPRKTNSSRKGTVTIFLEILQLVPLSNSTASDNESDSDTATATPPNAAEETPADTTSNQVVHSSEKANFNQKFPTADSPTTTTPSRRKDMAIHKRAARSVTVTAPPAITKTATVAVAAEKKGGNPSNSLTASASPSPTSKPLTTAIPVAPAAPAPSTKNANSAKASRSFPISDEGPPLENVTEPLGNAND